MKSNRLIPYADAIAFALEAPSNPWREFYSARLHLYVQSAPANRPQFAGQIYLEAYEKVRGGVTFLNWWAPATPTGVREFFRGLAERRTEFVSPRPYRLGQACDGTINSPVLHAYKVACDAFSLDADRLYKIAYPERGDDPPDWTECRRHADWQGGVQWPTQWDADAVDRLTKSLTEINYHSLRSEFAEGAPDCVGATSSSQTANVSAIECSMIALSPAMATRSSCLSCRRITPILSCSAHSNTAIPATSWPPNNGHKPSWTGKPANRACFRSAS